jgi:hypothetical protein
MHAILVRTFKTSALVVLACVALSACTPGSASQCRTTALAGQSLLAAASITNASSKAFVKVKVMFYGGKSIDEYTFHALVPSHQTRRLEESQIIQKDAGAIVDKIGNSPICRISAVEYLGGESWKMASPI